MFFRPSFGGGFVGPDLLGWVQQPSFSRRANGYDHGWGPGTNDDGDGDGGGDGRSANANANAGEQTVDGGHQGVVEYGMRNAAECQSECQNTEPIPFKGGKQTSKKAHRPFCPRPIHPWEEGATMMPIPLLFTCSASPV